MTSFSYLRPAKQDLTCGAAELAIPGRRLSPADLPYLLNIALNLPIIESTEPYAKRLEQRKETLLPSTLTVLPKLSFQIKKSTTLSGISEQMSLLELDSKTVKTPSPEHLLPSNQSLLSFPYGTLLDRGLETPQNLTVTDADNHIPDKSENQNPWVWNKPGHDTDDWKSQSTNGKDWNETILLLLD